LGRKFFWLILLVAFAATAFWLSRGPVRRWQQRRLLVATEASLKRGDLRGAFLGAHQALQNEPRDAQAVSVLARVADVIHSPEAVLWRQKLTELLPGRADLLIDLAAVATHQGEFFIAEQALGRVEGKARETVPFHQAAGAWAVAVRRYGLADDHFQKALLLAPKNDSLRLNLASLRLGLSAKADEARVTIEELRGKPEFHQAAVRALLTDARRAGDGERAMALATELRQGAGETIEDRLIYLEELQHAKSAAFDEELRTLQKVRAKDPGVVYAVVTWMNAHGLAAQSLAWGDSLPPSVRGQMPVPLGLAEAGASVGDWKRVRELVAGADWGELDFLRLAIETRAVDQLTPGEHDTNFKTRWELALNTTRGDPNALSMLARLVGGWGWKAEEAQTWWRVAAGRVGQRPALQALFRIYMADKNTRELYRVARRIYELEPTSPPAKNNVAMFGLLLGENLPEAQRLAAELHTAFPSESIFASTYALSLLKQGQPAEALKIMEALPADPSTDLYRGAALVAAGRRDEATPILQRALESPKLLAEERALAEQFLKSP
jgi:tetratricopeptide (TPR) repeat protein